MGNREKNNWKCAQEIQTIITVVTVGLKKKSVSILTLFSLYYVWLHFNCIYSIDLDDQDNLIFMIGIVCTTFIKLLIIM